MTVIWHHSAGQSFLAYASCIPVSRRQETAAEKVEAAADSEYQKGTRLRIKTLVSVTTKQLNIQLVNHDTP